MSDLPNKNEGCNCAELELAHGGVMAEDEMGIGSRVDQLRVQLAGCLTAAEGATHDPAKQGDYGWSLAYQKTLELRAERDKLNELFTLSSGKLARTEEALADMDALNCNLEKERKDRL